jgi:ankyrin repeat protein
MKRIFSQVIILTLMIVIISCGKKSEAQKNEMNPAQSNPVQLSSTNLNLNLLKKMRRAVLTNDLKSLRKAIAVNPELDLNQILNDGGETFLTLAIKKDLREIRNYLIEKGVKLESPNFKNETPLIAAVVSERDNSIKVLLDLKVDLEKKDSNGDTALHVALKKSMDSTAVRLINSGANISTLDRSDKNAYRLAEENDTPQALELIKKIMETESGTPSLTTLRKILLEPDTKSLSAILTRNPKIISDHIFEGMNPLALLVQASNEKNALIAADLLLKFEVNVNGMAGAEVTPLINAVQKNKIKFAELYLSKKANPQLLDKEGKSALIHAVESNNLKLVQLLLGHSAAEKYTFLQEGKKKTKTACDSSRMIQKSLKTRVDKIINYRIKRALNCIIFGNPPV